MAFHDMFVRDENGKRTNKIKPEYPRVFLGYVTEKSGEQVEIYGVDITKELTNECNSTDDVLEESVLTDNA